MENKKDAERLDEFIKEIKDKTIEIERQKKHLYANKITLKHILLLNPNLKDDIQFQYYIKFKCYCIGSRRDKYKKIFRSEKRKNEQWDISNMENAHVLGYMALSLSKNKNLLLDKVLKNAEAVPTTKKNISEKEDRKKENLCLIIQKREKTIAELEKEKIELLKCFSK